MLISKIIYVIRIAFISKELFEQMSDSEFALWGRWSQANVDWLLEFIDKEKLK